MRATSKNTNRPQVITSWIQTIESQCLFVVVAQFYISISKTITAVFAKCKNSVRNANVAASPNFANSSPVADPDSGSLYPPPLYPLWQNYSTPPGGMGVG